MERGGGGGGEDEVLSTLEDQGSRQQARVAPPGRKVALRLRGPSSQTSVSLVWLRLSSKAASGRQGQGGRTFLPPLWREKSGLG